MEIFFNPARRSIKAPGVFSACLVGGTDKQGVGNGDCLLLDFSGPFFAVCDASDRFSLAGRSFLLRLLRILDESLWPRDQDQWLERVNTAYAGQAYVERSTFTGVALLRGNAGGLCAFVAHGGDSLAFAANIQNNKKLFNTGVDMNFVGRATGLNKVALLDLADPGCRLVLATDGLADVARMAGLDTESLCLGALGRMEAHQAAEKLFAFMDRHAPGTPHDDMGVLVLNPSKALDSHGPRLLLGGTSAWAESRYKKALASLPDDWIPLQSLDPDLARTAGLHQCDTRN